MKRIQLVTSLIVPNLLFSLTANPPVRPLLNG
jgi:hypothetical protein